MGLRRKKPSQTQATDTLIGAGTEFEGILKTKAGLRIEGQFKGTIECQGDLVIGKHGIVRSQVTARNLTVAGKLFGEVTARGHLMILSQGEIEGNIAAASLVIEEGARFNGTSRMSRAEKDDAGNLQRTGKPERYDQADRMGKTERYDHADRAGKPDRFDQTDRTGKPDRFDPSDRAAKPERTDPALEGAHAKGRQAG
ncbi:MAG TPA: polymer-forming cytoskeletal protein [Paenibacillaceae bacterium]